MRKILRLLGDLMPLIAFIIFGIERYVTSDAVEYDFYLVLFLFLITTTLRDIKNSKK